MRFPVKKVFLIFLMVFLLAFSPLRLFSATILTESFDMLSNGSLNGQNGWTSTGWTVQSEEYFSGPKAVRTDTPYLQDAIKCGTSLSDGQIFFAVKTTNCGHGQTRNEYFAFNLMEDSTSKCSISINDRWTNSTCYLTYYCYNEEITYEYPLDYFDNWKVVGIRWKTENGSSYFSGYDPFTGDFSNWTLANNNLGNLNCVRLYSSYGPGGEYWFIDEISEDLTGGICSADNCSACTTFEQCFQFRDSCIWDSKNDVCVERLQTFSSVIYGAIMYDYFITDIKPSGLFQIPQNRGYDQEFNFCFLNPFRGELRRVENVKMIFVDYDDPNNVYTYNVGEENFPQFDSFSIIPSTTRCKKYSFHIDLDDLEIPQGRYTVALSFYIGVLKPGIHILGEMFRYDWDKWLAIGFFYDVGFQVPDVAKKVFGENLIITPDLTEEQSAVVRLLKFLFIPDVNLVKTKFDEFLFQHSDRFPYAYIYMVKKVVEESTTTEKELPDVPSGVNLAGASVSFLDFSALQSPAVASVLAVFKTMLKFYFYISAYLYIFDRIRKHDVGI